MPALAENGLYRHLHDGLASLRGYYMASIVRESLARIEDARGLLRDLFRSEADILPDMEQQVLRVHVHPMSNPRSDRAVAHFGPSQRGRIHLSRGQPSARLLDRRGSRKPELGPTLKSRRSGCLKMLSLKDRTVPRRQASIPRRRSQAARNEKRPRTGLQGRPIPGRSMAEAYAALGPVPSCGDRGSSGKRTCRDRVGRGDTNRRDPRGSGRARWRCWRCLRRGNRLTRGVPQDGS